MVRILSINNLSIKVFIVIIALTFSLQVNAQTITNSYVPGEIIVKYKDQTGAKASTAAKKNAFSRVHNRVAHKKALTTKAAWSDIGSYHYKVPSNHRIQDVIAELKNDPDVEYAEPNYYVSAATAIPESERMSGHSLDDFIAQTFGNEAIMAGPSYTQTSAPINMADAWNELAGGGTEVIVAVIDTGMDIDHDLLRDAIWKNTAELNGLPGVDDDGNGFIDDIYGWDFVQNDNSPHLPAYRPTSYNGTPINCPDANFAGQCAVASCNDHGTHVAGIIRGATQDIINGTSLPLNQSYVKIMPVKFLDCDGVGTTADAIKAIYYAVNNGAKILNNSWGGGSFSSALHSAIVHSYNYDRLFVAAAGNAASNIDYSHSYPAAYPVPNVISVGASNSFDYAASFSNYGISNVHIAAPGVAILSTVPDDLNNDGVDDTMTMSGTSMAAPMISGIAAMMAYKRPNMIGYQMRNIFMTPSVYEIPFVDSNANGVIDNGETIKLAGKVMNAARTNAKKAIIAAKNIALDSNAPGYDVSSFRGPASSGAGAPAGCGLVKKVYEDHDKNSQKPIHPFTAALAIIVLSLPFILALTARNSQKYKRRYDRFFLGSNVQISIGSTEFLGNVGTISLGGLSFNSSAVFKLGHTVSMNISGPDEKDHIDVEGEIVWMTNDKNYGVKFKNADESCLIKINEWTKDLKKS